MKLADMQGLGPCARKGLWVRVPPPALIVRDKFYNSTKEVNRDKFFPQFVHSLALDRFRVFW